MKMIYLSRQSRESIVFRVDVQCKVVVYCIHLRGNMVYSMGSIYCELLKVLVYNAQQSDKTFVLCER